MSNKTFGKIIKKNEQDANKTVATVMIITFVFFTLIYILNLAGIFVIDAIPMNIAYFTGSAILFMPTVINKLVGTASRKLKYIYVSLAALFLLTITAVLTYHVVVVYIYPVIIAGMYFSKRVTRFSAVITAAVTVGGQFLGFILGRPR